MLAHGNYTCCWPASKTYPCTLSRSGSAHGHPLYVALHTLYTLGALQAIDAMERIRLQSPLDGDVVTALARLYHRVEVSRAPLKPTVKHAKPATHIRNDDNLVTCCMR